MDDYIYYNDPDPYLILKGPVYPKMGKEFVQMVDSIKRKSEWEALGFKVGNEKNGNFNHVIKYGCYFRFRRIARENMHCYLPYSFEYNIKE